MTLARTLTIGCLFVLSSAACGASAPKELVSARTAYDRASHGPASKLNPTGLQTAKQALDAAEHSFAEKGDTQETKDLAWTAERQTHMAEAYARDLQLAKEQERSHAKSPGGETAPDRSPSGEESRAKTQAETHDKEFLKDRERRESAERREAATTSALAGFATVKQEGRGIVIRLSESELFASNSSELLPAAERPLREVAQALANHFPDSRMVVEGFADSHGAASDNHALSQRRAEAVRAYLVSRGIAPDRVQAQGYGVARPIADNASPMGRAKNRRVEIVVYSRDDAKVP